MKKSYFRIGIDLDGVLRDFIGQTIEQYRKFYPNKTYKYPDTWVLDEHFEIGKGIYDFISAYQDSIFTRAALINGAKELIEYSDTAKHDIIIITSPWGYTSRLANIKWLSDKLIPATELYQTKEKEKVECDIYIDDCADNILRYEQKWGNDFKTFKKFLIIYDQPWNRESFKYAIRSFDHGQTISLIESFQRNR